MAILSHWGESDLAPLGAILVDKLEKDQLCLIPVVLRTELCHRWPHPEAVWEKDHQALRRHLNMPLRGPTRSRMMEVSAKVGLP